MRRAGLVLLASAAIAGTLVWFTRSRRAEPAARLNVILVTIDTLRADRVGRGLTPAIDAVAARGVSFGQVRATVPLTLPSHVSLMTGTIPPVHGVRDNGAPFDRGRPTIARVFREAGYATAAFVGAYVLNRRFGLDEGFDVYDDAVRRDPDRAERLEAERPAAAVVDAAITWLSSRAEIGPRTADGGPRTPFFIWVHLYDPHAPYTPPAEFLQKAGGNPYDGEVAYADAQIGRLIATLEERGLTASTAIAITGDHGEGLGEHGEQTHGMLLYDSTLRVPLVIAAPGLVATGHQPCHPDLGPELLRIAGLADRLPREMGDGVQLFQGTHSSATPAARTECLAYSETLYPRQAGWHALAAAAESRWKLIVSSEPELYDLLDDPGELRNVAAGHPQTVQAISAKLGQVPRGSGVNSSQVSPEASERLRALGYVSGAAPVSSDAAGGPNPATRIERWTAFERALSTLQSGQVKEALAMLRPLALENPDAPVFQSTYARALRESGNARAAVAIYRRSVARQPADAALFHDLAAAAREAGDSSEALRAEQAALALDGGSAMALNGLGLIHADAGRAAEAAGAFERAAAADPTNASYWTNLGNARRELGSLDAAGAAYRKALDVDGGHVDALNGLGVTLVQQKRAREAVPLLTRALERAPDFHQARLNLGIAYQESGDAATAAAVYREILAAAPSSAARERRAAAELLRQLGRRD
jgi:arylsulfatase A-like enzyme/Flp pilus assembly protein TadD